MSFHNMFFPVPDQKRGYDDDFVARKQTIRWNAELGLIIPHPTLPGRYVWFPVILSPPKNAATN